jgi:hypothetical protein
VTLENLDDGDNDVDICRAWESIRENIKASATDSPGCYVVRQYKPWFDEECAKLLISCSYEDVYKSFRTGRLERELQMVQLSATRCSCIAIL